MKQKEKLAIVYKAVVEQKEYRLISAEFRTTKYTISRLVAKAKKNPKFISELFSNEQLKEKKRELIHDVVEEMRVKNVFIDSCKMVKQKAETK